jgi:hypothetical protein
LPREQMDLWTCAFLGLAIGALLIEALWAIFQ